MIERGIPGQVSVTSLSAVDSLLNQVNVKSHFTSLLILFHNFIMVLHFSLADCNLVFDVLFICNSSMCCRGYHAKKAFSFNIFFSVLQV